VITEKRINNNDWQLDGKDKDFYAIWSCMHQAYTLYYKGEFFKRCDRRSQAEIYLK